VKDKRPKPSNRLRLVLAVLVIDRVLKWWFMTRGSYVLNPGVSFGLSVDWRLVGLILLAALMAKARLSSWSWLVVAGGVSNIWDRLAYGGVVDWLHLGFLSFNLADMMIVAGSLWLIKEVWFEGKNYLL